MTSTSNDNRDYKRASTSTPVKIEGPNGAEYEGHLVNVSEGGAYIESDYSLTKGFCGIISTDSFSAEMTVVRSGDTGDQFGFGMIFEAPSQETMDKLREIIASVAP